MVNGIYSGGNTGYYGYYNAAAARGAGAASTQGAGRMTVIPAAQPETPVQPVARVTPAPEVALDKEALLRQLENDPAAAIVRSRIQYPEDEAQNAQELAKSAAPDIRSAQEVMEDGVCETCKNRKYQDGSDDPGVSFKNATSVDPHQASAAVRSHEYEHVNREQDKAAESGRKVVSQSVTYNSAICPECGKVYTSGGETKTVTAAKPENELPEDAPADEEARQGFSLLV